MIGQRGRKAQWAYIEGELVMIKKPVKVRGSLAVLLPKEWTDAQALNGKIKYFSLDIKDSLVIIRPLFTEVETGVL